MSEWVNVKERMPEQAGLKVLVSAYSKNGHRSVFTAFIGYGDGKWYTPDHDKMQCPYKGENTVCDRWTITHWMSLPEPPKEEIK